MSKIRKSAKDEMCTLNISGVCNYDPATTVLAHLPDESKGMAKKSDDISSCYACSACHDLIDGRDNRKFREFNSGDIEWYQRRAQTRTLRRLIEKGIVIVK
jgi:hypothetical protein